MCLRCLLVVRCWDVAKVFGGLDKLEAEVGG